MFRKMFILMSQVAHSLCQIIVKLIARTMCLFNRPSRLKAGLRGKNFFTGDVLKNGGLGFKIALIVRWYTVPGQSYSSGTTISSSI